MRSWGQKAYAKLMLDRLFYRIFASPLGGTARFLARIGIGPGGMSVLAFLFGVAALVMIVGERYPLAVLLLAAHRICDAVAGTIMRLKMPKPVSRFLAITLRYTIYAGVPFAFVLTREEYGVAASFLLLCLVFLIVTDLAARLYAPAKPQGERSWPPFLVSGNSETFLIYAAMLLVPWTFAILPYVYGFLCFVSAIARMVTFGDALSHAVKP